MPRHISRLLRASALALCLSTPLQAQTPFTAPADFTGTLQAGASERGRPALAGTSATISGSGLTPGQQITLQRGSTPLAETPLEVDAEGNLSFTFDLPKDAATGLHPIILLGENPSLTQIVDLKVSPDIPLTGSETFDISSTFLTAGLYQVAYSPARDALFVTAAVGRPPVTESALLRVNPETLEIEGRIAPAPAPAREDGRDPGVFAVYGVAVDDDKQTVWVTNTRQDTVAVYAQSDLSLIHQFEPGAAHHARDVVIDAARQRAYVSAALTPDVAIFDTETLTALDPFTIPSTRRGQAFAIMSIALDAENRRLFAVSGRTNEAAVITLDTGDIRTLPLPGAKNPAGVAHDPATDRLFVASQTSDNLLILDLATGDILHDVPVGAGALNVVFDTTQNLAFVSNRGAGTLTAVTPDGEIVANLEGGTFANHATTDGRGTIFAVNKTTGPDDTTGDRIWRIEPAN